MNVFQLRPERQPIGHFIRIGRNYHEIEALFSADALPIDRAVFDACHLRNQADLLRALGQGGRQTILDTNVAELSSIGRFESSVRQAPWAIKNRPLEPSDVLEKQFTRNIAKFAFDNRFNTVLTPTHLLSGAEDRWLDVDRRNCINLRKALDEIGGQKLSIDYVLMLSNAQFRDPGHRQRIIRSLQGLPFENLWLRISGFGVDATGFGIQRHIAAVQDFLTLQKPIVADNVAGLTALALLSFSGVGGIAHGAGDMERFDASSWKKPPENGGGGHATRILVAQLDRQLTRDQINLIMLASGGRKLVSCPTSCCRQGMTGAFADTKGHYLRQRRAQLERLAAVPDLMRPYHFVHQEVTQTHRISTALSQLRLPDKDLKAMLVKEQQRQHRLLQALEHMQATPTTSKPAQAIAFRSGAMPSRKPSGAQWLQH